MRYFLGLGSNVGNRTKNLGRAIRLLRARGVKVLRSSSVYRTEPVDNPDQPWFMNQILAVRAALAPQAMLALIKSIEVEMVRVRTVAKGPRTIDIDILLAGDSIIDTPDLVIPHPRLALRNFVLVPLAEIAPDLVHPVLKQAIADLVRDSKDPAKVEKTVRPARLGKAARGH